MRAAFAALLLLGGIAHATPAPMIKPPAGWSADPERASELATKVAALKPFGAAKVIVATEVYVPPSPGVALFVTRITSEKLPGTPLEAARHTLEEFRTTSGKLYAWQDGPDAETSAYIARAEWTDMAVHTQTVARLVIVTTADGLVTVRGECLSSDGGDGAPVNACTQALASLDTGVPREVRLAQSSTAMAVTATTPAPEPEPEPAPAMTRSEPARITDGQQVRLSPMTIAQSKPEADRRPIYLGAGIVVLAVAFWWNRRQRERFEREDEGGGAAKPRRVREASRGDDDADDLAAAARGDAPKDET